MSDLTRVRTRFAPSPTGFMHIGNLRTALYCYLFAKQQKGDFILRIEDTDLERFVPGAIDVIYNTLKEAKMEISEGPNEGGNYGPYVQTQRKDIYLKYAKELIEKGAAYYCFCDKERLDSLENVNGIKRYDKHCLHLPKEEVEMRLARGDKYVIRQNMPTEGVSEFDDLVFGHVSIPNNELEDQILIKSDGLPTYNFANVIDDHLMKISHVMRGNEYLSSTPKYNLLYDAFGWERPQYVHLTPIMKDATRKLSKRHGDANFDDFIKKGFLPEAIINYIALLGWSPKGEQEKFTIEELIEKFSIDGLSKSSSIFDYDKMRWLNGEYIKELDFDKFMEYARPWFDKSDIKGMGEDAYVMFGKLLQTRIEIFSDIIDKVKFINDFKVINPLQYHNKKLKIDEKVALNVLKQSIPELEKISFTEDKLHEVILKVASDMELKSGVVYTVLRIALSSYNVTPGGSVEIGLILGKDESLRRLKQALKWLEEGMELISKEDAKKILEVGLSTGADFCELFFEHTKTNHIEYNTNAVANASSSIIHGASVRIIKDGQEVFGYLNDWSNESLIDLTKKLSGSLNGKKIKEVAEFKPFEKRDIVNPKRLGTDVSNEEKIALLNKLNEGARSVDEVSQVMGNLVDKVQQILVVNSNGTYVMDIRTNVRLGGTAIAGSGSNMQSVGDSIGDNTGYEFFEDKDVYALGKEIGEAAKTMVHADEMVGGVMTVVVHNGFGGVLLHEACVHSLEATAVAKGASVFCGKLGQKIASDVVTAIDDGTRINQWGSLNYDDEGNPTQRNVLIENGILKSYLVDYRNSFKMNHPITGSGRRQSYKYSPTSRMTNTFFAPGKDSFDDIIKNTKYGLFAKRMGGGSVNPSTGEFNFAVNEGYMIEDGKITKPVRGATLVGSGSQILMNIDMISDNLAFGHGMCGSASGSIPTDVGEPTIRVQNITVGGRGK